MASKKRCIAKGNYRRSQIGHFMTVKNYIFLRDADRKCLLLRFVNDMDVNVDGMIYTVFQYDEDGKLITKSRVRYGGILVRPHETYAHYEALAVDDACVDFEVVFSEVSSGKYVYRVIDRIVSVYYNNAPAVPLPDSAEEETVRRHTVRRRIFGDESSAALVTAMVLVILIALNIMNIFFAYKAKVQEWEDSKADETQAPFETGDPLETTAEISYPYTADKNGPETVSLNFGDGERYVEI